MSSVEVISLYLEGFAKINTGMHIDRLFLDFDSMPNQTYLFAGNSGSGKSSILKSIHPFAFNSGTGDETSNSDLIMSGRDGRKIITYRLNRDIIECKHIYNRKQDGSIQVKSYFSLNEEELNPSGLVSTFKELVYKYFCIDESFLTLLALGNSVRSMVDYTSGERKKLSVKIFTELNIYMTYYKNASSVVKELKTILNNVIDKLDRYKDYDKKELKKTIKELDNLIEKTQCELDNILKNEGILTANMNSTMEDYKKYEDSRGKITELLASVESLKRKRKTSKDCTVLENDKNTINGNMVNAEIRKSSLEENIKSELNFKELKLNNKNQLEDSLNRLENNINEIELEKLLANIDSELSMLSDIELIDGVDYKEKKESLVKANIYLDELKSMSVDLVSEVDMIELIPETVNAFLKDKAFDTKVEIAYQAALERINNLFIANQISGDIKVPNINYKCDDKECPYKKMYNDIRELLCNKKEDANRILSEENNRLKIAENRIIIKRILKKLYGYINNHIDVLGNLPDDIFNPITFIDKFLETTDREVYDRNLIGSSVTYMERACRKSELIALKTTTENQLKGINTTKDLYNSMKVELEQVNMSIDEINNTIELHQNDLKYNNGLIEEYSKLLKSINEEMSIAKELEDKRKEIQIIQSNLSSLEELKLEHDKLSNEIKSLRNEADTKRTIIKEYRERYNNIVNIMESMDSLEKEKVVLAERYSEAVMIKDAVSPSKGIPVEFIDDVIRNQMIDSINELMHVAYPDITLLKDPNYLIINDKEFTIPYKKNGVIIGDISEASDGERAMLSLAFSLVLIRLVSKVYNIMLLDEMDTALDKYGRSKYIDIIEQYMETINASQIFLISHNSMFDMYSINVLQTTKSVINSNSDTVIVPVYEQDFTPDRYKEEDI